MNQDGFADLRLNMQGQKSDESVWPSFADIMSVIVMIFMLAMVVLLARNLDLVKQLRSTMEAERFASELARTTSQAKDVLQSRLTETESELSMARLEMLQLDEANQKASEELRQREAMIAELKDQRKALNLKMAGLDQRITELLEQINDRDKTLLSQSADFAELNERYDALRALQKTTADELSEARIINARQLDELSFQASRIAEIEQGLVDEQQRYSDLKVKYDKLVRPARTPRGRYVVEVKYARLNGQTDIQIRRPEDAEPLKVDEKEMHRLLGKVKDKYPNSTYIKIIFPKESGLSYSEAWTFTNDLLKRYDYYYQEGSATPAAAN